MRHWPRRLFRNCNKLKKNPAELLTRKDCGTCIPQCQNSFLLQWISTYSVKQFFLPWKIQVILDLVCSSLVEEWKLIIKTKSFLLWHLLFWTPLIWVLNAEGRLHSPGILWSWSGIFIFMLGVLYLLCNFFTAFLFFLFSFIVEFFFIALLLNFILLVSFYCFNCHKTLLQLIARDRMELIQIEPAAAFPNFTLPSL